VSINLPTPPGLHQRPFPNAPRLGSLLQAIDQLMELPPESPVPAAALGDEILVLQRQINRLHALILDRLALFDAQDGAHQVAGATTSSWLRHRGGLAVGQTSDLVRTARHLRQLPATQKALRAGDLTAQHVRTISHTVSRTSDHVVTEHHAAVAAEVERVRSQALRSAFAR
jgi:hypothetical protein